MKLFYFFWFFCANSKQELETAGAFMTLLLFGGIWLIVSRRRWGGIKLPLSDLRLAAKKLYAGEYPSVFLKSPVLARKSAFFCYMRPKNSHGRQKIHTKVTNRSIPYDVSFDAGIKIVQSRLEEIRGCGIACGPIRVFESLRSQPALG